MRSRWTFVIFLEYLFPVLGASIAFFAAFQIKSNPIGAADRALIAAALGWLSADTADPTLPALGRRSFIATLAALALDITANTVHVHFVQEVTACVAIAAALTADFAGFLATNNVFVRAVPVYFRATTVNAFRRLLGMLGIAS